MALCLKGIRKYINDHSMLNVKECRKILKENGYEGIEDMTDERILELRDFLYHLARIQIEDEEKRLAKSSNT